MQVNVFNARNPNGKRVPVTVTVEHSDKKSTNDGELVYLITLQTGAKSISGGAIDIVYIDDVTLANVKKELEKAITTIAEQIDWGTLEADKSAPLIVEYTPTKGETNVPIEAQVFLRLRDPFPASFINPATIKLKVNGVDVTSQVTVQEKETEQLVFWSPTIIR